MTRTVAFSERFLTKFFPGTKSIENFEKVVQKRTKDQSDDRSRDRTSQTRSQIKSLPIFRDPRRPYQFDPGMHVMELKKIGQDRNLEISKNSINNSQPEQKTLLMCHRMLLVPDPYYA